MDGWVDGWMGGWMGVKAGLRIAYSNQKFDQVRNKYVFTEREGKSVHSSVAKLSFTITPPTTYR